MADPTKIRPTLSIPVALPPGGSASEPDRPEEARDANEAAQPSPTTPTPTGGQSRDFSEWEERPFTLASASRRMSMLPTRPLLPPSSAPPLAPRRSIAIPKSSSSEELSKQLIAATLAAKEAVQAREEAENEEQIPASTVAEILAPLAVPAGSKAANALTQPSVRPSTMPNLPIPLAAPLVPPAELPVEPTLSLLPPIPVASTPSRPLERPSKAPTKEEKTFGPERVGEFDLGPVIGKGTFAICRLARQAHSGQMGVCKLITFPEPIQPRDRLHFFALREAAVLMALPPHSNVTTLYEFHRSDAHVELVMSLAPGEELFQYCEKFSDGVPEPTSRNIVTQLLSALDHIHTHFVMHRDIKLDNVFFDEASGKVTIIDFGLATFFHPSVRLSELLGTASYASPSLLTLLEDGYGSMLPNKGHQDLWALGVLAHGMMTGRFPFEETEPARLLREIYAKKKEARPFHLPDSWEPEARERAEDFIKFILDPGNEGKITARSLLSHPWIRGPDSENAPRIPISKPTPSFVTPTRELADASNYARNFSELARLVAAKVQTRQARLAIPFGGGNLGTTSSNANGLDRPESALGSSRPSSAMSNGNSSVRSPAIVPTRPASRLSMLSHPTDDEMDRGSFESDSTVGHAGGSSSAGQPAARERKKGGLKKFFALFG